MAKKILIMTVPFGSGHYTMAERTKELINEKDASVQIDILDVLTDFWPAFSQSSTNLYTSSTGKGGALLYRLYYRFTDRFPLIPIALSVFAFSKYMRNLTASRQPDLVIATFPLIGNLAARARDRLKLSFPVITTITDAGRVQGVWLFGSEDTILAATPNTIDYAAERRATSSHVRHIGFPVARAFYELENSVNAKRSLGLKTTSPLVLISSGGLGLTPHLVTELCQILRQSEVNMQFMFIAGKNEQLKSDLDNIVESDERFTVVGYVKDMPTRIAASDVVCAKSGWLSISEVIVAQRPLILYSVIPGQEEENAKFVVENGYGLVVTDPFEVAQTIIDRSWNKVKTKPSNFASPESRSALARYYLELLENNNPV